jgi:DNA gyrase subunit A
MVVTRSGIVLRTSLDEIRETGRSTQGVKVMNLNEDDDVVGIAVLRQSQAVAEDGDQADTPA